jgi:hypothetical protein
MAYKMEVISPSLLVTWCNPAPKHQADWMSILHHRHTFACGRSLLGTLTVSLAEGTPGLPPKSEKLNEYSWRVASMPGDPCTVISAVVLVTCREAVVVKRQHQL